MTMSCPLNGDDCIQGTCVGEGETGWANSWGLCSPIQGELTCGADNKTLTDCNISQPGPKTIAVCDSAPLCQQSVMSMSNMCGSKLCDAGTWTCATDGTLQHCKADETGYDMMTKCASAPLCASGLQANPTAPMCTPPTCGPGAAPPTGNPALYECKDGALLSCGMDQQGYVPMDCMGKQCDPGTGSCTTITADQHEVSVTEYATFVAAMINPATLPAGCSGKTTFAPDPTCMMDPSVCDPTTAMCGNVPQVCVDWCDAYAYCQSKGEHLCGKLGTPGSMVALSDYADPGKDEWMNACSAGGQYTWTESNMWSGPVEGQKCNGNDYPAQNTMSGKSSMGLAYPNDDPVLGGKCRSQVPSYQTPINMSGNVWEWENSCSLDVAQQTASGNDTCRVRGGSFNSGQVSLRCDANSPFGDNSMNQMTRNQTRPDVGIRCCQ
jgi:formylglycine-generating enzyme required for sulfatase activity